MQPMAGCQLSRAAKLAESFQQNEIWNSSRCPLMPASHGSFSSSSRQIKKLVILPEYFP
jgi:hypothetical protein